MISLFLAIFILEPPTKPALRSGCLSRPPAAKDSIPVHDNCRHGEIGTFSSPASICFWGTLCLLCHDRVGGGCGDSCCLLSVPGSKQQFRRGKSRTEGLNSKLRSPTVPSANLFRFFCTLNGKCPGRLFGSFIFWKRRF